MSDFQKRECGDQKVSLGPVYSINPKCVKKIEYIEYTGKLRELAESWLIVTGYNVEMTTELESCACCERVLAECLAINPDIEVVRTSTIVFDEEENAA